MFNKNLKKSKQKQAEAGKKVYARFVKGKSTLNKYQHLHDKRYVLLSKLCLMKCLTIRMQKLKL